MVPSTSFMGYKMGQLQCVLGVLVLFIGLVQSWSRNWDFATASRGDLNFFSSETKSHADHNTGVTDTDKVVYDVVHDRLFFSQFDGYALISSCDLETLKIKSIVYKQGKKAQVDGLAYDPVQELLFWSNAYNESIHSISTKVGFKGNGYGNLIVSTQGRTPHRIAVDSCKGYIYWVSTDKYANKLPTTIERARFDGSGREVVIGTDLKLPELLVIDQQTQKLYWTDGTRVKNKVADEEKQFTIESAGLNGDNRTVIYDAVGMDQPMALAISNDYIYFELWTETIVIRIRKNTSIQEISKEYEVDTWGRIFTNYKIEDQILGVDDCEALKNLTKSAVDDRNKRLFCVHGTRNDEEDQCRCDLGYTGERCEVLICENYCLQGYCGVSEDGKPLCRCKHGYSGKRCEVDKCLGYCLNKGVCSVSENGDPVCQCREDFEGARCEASAMLNKCFKKVVSMAWDVIKEDVTSIVSDNGVKSKHSLSTF